MIPSTHSVKNAQVDSKIKDIGQVLQYLQDQGEGYQ